MGYLYLTSAELVLLEDRKSARDGNGGGNLDWALFEPRVSPTRGFFPPGSGYSPHDAFQPGSSGSDADTNRKVVLLSHRLGYPNARISPQVAFVATPSASSRSRS